MFDIKAAVGACFEAFPSKEARTYLAQFIQLNLVDQSGIMAQWRAFGKDADIINTFLTKAGLTEGVDFIRRVSTLDDNVTDFRWVPEGLYPALRTMFRTRDTAVPSLLGYIWGNDPLDTDECFANLPCETVSTPTMGTTTKFRVEEITVARCQKFIECIEADANATEEDKKLAAVLKESDCAVPNLGTIEHILRYFGEVDSESPALFSSGANAVQHKTVLRHITQGMKLPNNELFASTIVPFAYDSYKRAVSRGEDPEESPVNSFFYRDRDKSAKESCRGNPTFVSAFEELNPSLIGTSLLRASHLNDLWRYVHELYRKFFATNVHIFLCSRLVLNNNDAIWARRNTVTGTTYDFTNKLREMADRGFISSAEQPAGVNVTLILGTSVFSSDGSDISATRHVKYYVSAPELENPDTYTQDHIPTKALSDEWFAFVHSAGRDLVSTAMVDTCHAGYAPSRENARKNLATLVKRTTASSVKSDTAIIKRTNFKLNDCFLTSETASNRMSGINCVMQGLVMAARKYGYSETAGYAFWKKDPKDPYADVHSDDTVISAVYSGIESDETYMGALKSIDGSTNIFTKFIKELPAHQCDPVTKHGLYTRTMIIETNIAYDGRPLTEYSGLLDAVKRLAVVNMLCNHRDSEVAIAGKYSSYFPNWPSIEHAISAQHVTSHIRPALSMDDVTFSGGSSSPDSASRVLTRVQDMLRSKDSEFTFCDGFRSTFSVLPVSSSVCNAEVRIDDFNRVYVVLRFSKAASFVMMATFRVLLRINPLDAFTRSLMREGCCLTPTDNSEEALYKEVFTQLYHTDTATDFGRRAMLNLGIGPMFREERIAADDWPSREQYQRKYSGTNGFGLTLPVYW